MKTLDRLEDEQKKQQVRSPWNSLEVAKIILLSILIPGVGFLIQREFKFHDDRLPSKEADARGQQAKLEAAAREQQAKLEAAAREQQAKLEAAAREQQANLEAAAREREAFRRSLWERIGPKLNKIYCYFLYVGSWKTTDHDEIVALKREVDADMYTNKAFFSANFFHNYLAFTDATFDTFGGWEQDAKLRTVPIRTQDLRLPASYFTCEDNGEAIFRTYWKLEDSASYELFGLTTINPADPPKPPTDYLQLALNSGCHGFANRN
jgi:hypothetical protein